MRFQAEDRRARSLVLDVTSGGDVSPSDLYDHARRAGDISLASVRRAVWALVAAGTVELTPDFRVRLGPSPEDKP